VYNIQLCLHNNFLSSNFSFINLLQFQSFFSLIQNSYGSAVFNIFISLSFLSHFLSRNRYFLSIFWERKVYSRTPSGVMFLIKMKKWKLSQFLHHLVLNRKWMRELAGKNDALTNMKSILYSLRKLIFTSSWLSLTMTLWARRNRRKNSFWHWHMPA
jgi:hypothetical protein